MHRIEVAHTADLPRATLAAARSLLSTVFEDGFTDDDWDHTLGGMHVLVWEDDQLVGHGAVVQRRLWHQGRALRTGYVEGVGVRGDRRRLGYARTIMTELARVIRAAYQLGALATTEPAAGFYHRIGWQCWRGPTYASTLAGPVRTPDEDGGIFVLPVPNGTRLDLAGDLTCDWRDGEPW